MQPDLTPRIGRYLTTSTLGEMVNAYLPVPLPPTPPLDLARLLGRIARADQALGRLDGMTAILPSNNLFVYMYVRKEALLSSQIEGTQSSLSDLLLFEGDNPSATAFDDVGEVSNYIAAMDHGLSRLASGFPLSLRLITEMHQKLLAGGRGSAKQPGEFRKSQNWIGGSRPGNALFVPPPPERLIECLGPLELFLHDRDTYPVLIRAALAHVQFETIHPFLDGNGRLGRLLITLMLCEEKALQEPILYLSLHFKTHRNQYYELLQIVRKTGDWEAWLEFFLDGVIETSQQGVSTAKRLLRLFEEDRAKISASRRAASTSLLVHGEVQKNPFLSVSVAATQTNLSQPTVQSAVNNLCELGILEEITGKQRRRIYKYKRYLAILEEGTEPLPP